MSDFCGDTPEFWHDYLNREEEKKMEVEKEIPEESNKDSNRYADIHSATQEERQFFDMMFLTYINKDYEREHAFKRARLDLLRRREVFARSYL